MGRACGQVDRIGLWVDHELCPGSGLGSWGGNSMGWDQDRAVICFLHSPAHGTCTHCRAVCTVDHGCALTLHCHQFQPRILACLPILLPSTAPNQPAVPFQVPGHTGPTLGGECEANSPGCLVMSCANHKETPLQGSESDCHKTPPLLHPQGWQNWLHVPQPGLSSVPGLGRTKGPAAG